MGICISSKRTVTSTLITPDGEVTASGTSNKKLSKNGNDSFAGEHDIVLNKKQFVFEHTSDNIRDDYLIGKVLGTGISASKSN